MKGRIQQLIELEGISAGQFADKVGIQRSTLSHILNGRNNASIEIVAKIHTAYPGVAIQWLMFGEGDRDERILEELTPPSLFENISINTPRPPVAQKYEQEKGSKKPPSERETSYNELIEEDKGGDFPIPTSREVVKIMVFYSDNTFETFTSDIRLGKG